MLLQPLRSDLLFQLAVLGDITRHMLGLKNTFNGQNLPLPDALWSSAHGAFDPDAASWRLSDEGWRRFPVLLQRVERGNALTASFSCRTQLNGNATLGVERLTAPELENIAAGLRDANRSPQVEWNLHMVNAALVMTRAVGHTKQGIPLHVIDSFIAGNAEALAGGLKRHLGL